MGTQSDPPVILVRLVLDAGRSDGIPRAHRINRGGVSAHDGHLWLNQARVNLERTQIRSPVNGWVTNLLVQRDAFATVGQNEISLVDADSFWIDAYFEETKLASIHEGDAAKIKCTDRSSNGRVGSISRGISVANAAPNQQGVATVNPIFTWVRLAQRIPVRV